MSGHNKWSQVKRQKGAADANKSKVWGKLAKRIAVESKKANGDVNSPSLRAVIEMSKKENMPKDSIERAVAKGIAHEIKHLLGALGLSLASPGSALWAFEKTAEGWAPKTTVPISESDNEKLMQILEKIDAYDDVQEVYTNAE